MTVFRDDIVLLLPHLRAYARSLTAGDRSLADDLVQDTLLNALRAQHQFTPGTNLRAWLFTILRNRLRSVMGRRQIVIELQDDMIDQKRSTPAPQESGIEFAAFRHAFGRLCLMHREVLVMTVVQGLPYERVAELCGCRVGTVKSRVSRARDQLRQMLLDDELAPGGLDAPAAAARATAGAAHSVPAA